MPLSAGLTSKVGLLRYKKYYRLLTSFVIIFIKLYLDITCSNQRLGSAFDDLDPRLSLFVMSSAPAKKLCGGCQMCIPRSIHPTLSHKISTQIRIRSAFFQRRTQKLNERFRKCNVSAKMCDVFVVIV